MKKINHLFYLVIILLVLSGCGGGGSSDNTQIPLLSNNKVLSQAEASAFLTRATFGAKQNDIQKLVTLNNYEKWLEQQIAQSPSYHIQWGNSHAKGVAGISDLKDSPEDWKVYSDGISYLQRDAWWDIATFGKDQLRQRVAFALSEILVISKNNGVLINQPDARMAYYDVLVKNAFGNFEDLLKEVTYHPSMGKYLSYLGNPKADPEKGTHPDENYAREVMQLFTIGLYELNKNGTKKLKNGKTIPTYSQTDIKEMARVFTGLTDQNGFFFAADGGSTHQSRTSPMIAMEEYHDHGQKIILGHTINAGGNTFSDINAALHILFNHPNTAPFISKQLIQRLVTSNPSTQYIERIARVFMDNGEGERGDLKAVIKAILLDKEALRCNQHPTNFGKFREPLLYFTHLFRAFNAKNSENVLKQGDQSLYRYASFNFNGTGMMQQEGSLEALTVFNYFTPEDAPYLLKKQTLLAPELSVYGKRGIDDVLMGIINKNSFIYDTYHLTINLDISKEKDFIKQKDLKGLLNHLDLLLSANNLDSASKTTIIEYLKNAKNDNGQALTTEQLARYAIALVMTSPDYALQR